MVKSARIFGSSGIPGKTPPPVSPTYQKADHKNAEGFPAFSRSIEEQTLSVLMTSTLSNTFYTKDRELAQETVEVLRKMAAKDPEFLARACAYARDKGLLKLAPTVGLAVLSAEETERKEWFRKAFPKVIQIPDDLREFVVLCRKAQIRKGTRIKEGKVLAGTGGLGGVAKVMVQHSLRHLSEFHTVKYGSGRSEVITLRDILRMAHPKPKDEAMRERFGWLVNGWSEVGSEPSPTNSMIWALEKLKRTENEAEVISLVEKYRLPAEVVIPSVRKMTVKIRKALLKSMPYMALLRNLNTLGRAGVLEDKATVKEIAKRLSDPEAVKKSRQFPFRFLNASRAFNGPQEIRDALTDALEASVTNLPEIRGRVCVSNDVSYSMSGKASDKGTATVAEIAAIFAGALLKKCEDVVLLPFDTEVRLDLAKVSRRDTVMSIAERIGVAERGTKLGAPIQHLLKHRTVVDVFIGLTDNEDWVAKGFLSYWEEYKRTVNPKAKTVLVTIAPERDFVAPEGYPDVHFVQGWSDSVLRYIPMVLESGLGQVEDVRKYDLSMKPQAFKDESIAG